MVNSVGLPMTKSEYRATVKMLVTLRRFNLATFEFGTRIGAVRYIMYRLEKDELAESFIGELIREDEA